MSNHGIQYTLGMLLVAVATASAEDTSQKAFDRAKAELYRAVRDGQITGAAHLVVRDGRTLYSEVAGFRDIEDKTPLKPDSILRIYSMSCATRPDTATETAPASANSTSARGSATGDPPACFRRG